MIFSLISIVRVVVSSLAVVLACGAVVAQTQGGATVTGRVKSSTGETPSPLKVVLINLEKDELIRSANEIDKITGNFTFRYVQDGKYRLAACAGITYVPTWSPIEINGGKDRSKDLVLEPARTYTGLKGTLDEKITHRKNVEVSALGYDCTVATTKTIDEAGTYFFQKLPVPPKAYKHGMLGPDGKLAASAATDVEEGKEIEVILRFETGPDAKTTLVAELVSPGINLPRIDDLLKRPTIYGSSGRDIAIYGASASEFIYLIDGVEVPSVVRSGTNDFHGRLQYAVMNDAFAARNFFNLPDFDTFRKHDMSAGLGGPIKKNHAFFYVGYDLIRGVEAPAFSPVLTKQLPVLNEQLGRLGLPQEDLRGFLTTSARDDLRANVDIDLRPTDKLTFRYNFLRDEAQHDLNNLEFGRGGTAIAPSAARDVRRKNNSLFLQYRRVLSRYVQTQAEYQYLRDSWRFDPVSPTEVSLLIPGVAIIGRANNLVTGDANRRSAHVFGVNVRIDRGKQKIDFGGRFELARTQFRLATFEAGRAVIPGLAALATPVPQVELFQIGSGGSVVHYNSSRLNLYFQDTYRINPQLTITYGLGEKIEFPPAFRSNELDGLQPQVAIAWANKGGDAVLKLGYRMSRQYLPELPFGFQLLMGDNLQPGAPLGVRRVISVTGTANASSAFQQFLLHAPLVGPELATIYDFDANSPTFQIVEGSFTKAWGTTTTITFAYNRNWGTSLLASTNVNLPPPALIGGRPDFMNSVIDPRFAQIFEYRTDGRSTYDSGSVNVNFRPNSHFNLSANYAFSKSLDDLRAISFEATPENVFDRRNERANSDFVPRHKISVTLRYEPLANWNRPDAKGNMSNMKRIFGSLYLAPIYDFNSGNYFNVLTGSDANHDGNPLTDRPLSVGRNTFLGQSYSRADLSVGSTTTIGRGERMKVGWRVDFFNVLNRTNFRDFNTVLGQTDLAGLDPKIVFGRKDVPNFDFRRPLTSSNFGVATKAYEPRRIQLQLKFDF